MQPEPVRLMPPKSKASVAAPGPESGPSGPRARKASRSVWTPDSLQGRDYHGRRWVYTQASVQPRGFSVGINLSPERECDYRCRYCGIPKIDLRAPGPVEGQELTLELEQTLQAIRSGELFRHPAYRRFPSDWKTLSRVMLSGEGEPTLCPNFNEVVERLVHSRARGRHAFFQLVLETNGSGLERPEVLDGLGLFTSQDEVWVKLDAGTEDRFRFMSGVDLPFDRVLARILAMGLRRPVVIHSLFARVDGSPPSRSEITAYLECLGRLRAQGAMIQRVQIRSVTRPPAASGCSHLPLGILSDIARQVRREVGVEAEIS